MGNAWKDAGKLDEAMAAWRLALQISRDHARASYNLGVALRDEGRLEESVACFRRTLEVKPNDASALTR